jgi:hypothetical protein
VRYRIVAACGRAQLFGYPNYPLSTLDMVGEAGGSYHAAKAPLDGIVAKVEHPVEQRESIGAVLRLVKGGGRYGRAPGDWYSRWYSSAREWYFWGQSP